MFVWNEPETENKEGPRSKDRVVVVGSFNTDLMARTPQLPAAGETILGDLFRMGPGGKGSNQAIAIARLGITARFVGCLGTDVFGDLAQSALSDEGVDTSFVKRTTDFHTGAALIVVNEVSGENWIIVVPGANDHLLPEDICAAPGCLEEASVLLLQLEIPLPTVERAAQLGGEKGLRVILNPAPAQPLPGSLLARVDILTPNETELERLTNRRARTLVEVEAAARALLLQGPGAVVVTLGANGALCVTAEEVRHFPGYTVETVDTTGAGDSFSGALAAALAAGSHLEDAIKFANAAAALSVTRVGTAPAMPTLAEVRAFLDDPTARNTKPRHDPGSES
jgi:ribokinase